MFDAPVLNVQRCSPHQPRVKRYTSATLIAVTTPCLVNPFSVVKLTVEPSWRSLISERGAPRPKSRTYRESVGHCIERRFKSSGGVSPGEETRVLAIGAGGSASRPWSFYTAVLCVEMREKFVEYDLWTDARGFVVEFRSTK